MTSKVNINEPASELLLKSLAYLAPLSIDYPILDLACGHGRNGLCLLEGGHDVVFADRSLESLAYIKKSLRHELYQESKEYASFWHVDFEQANFKQLAEKQYSAIVVFRYLHRALFEQIKQAIIPGGLIVYETFTTEQAKFGKPSNPDFLLKENELKTYFSDWKVLHYFEGVVKSNNNNSQAIAQIIAIKPE
ncbi:methyltransferase domain-containing protein [Litorilituus lipolyticus]|uniref:Methyltransferase domain-containing protein n=1 Tax=Litorilituus lipolyticus TaxID=2491017 RepID=A0A502KVB3_9GAMM|nr:methyltransferase domain-containing protein [Litorilituus lipolyticus]TPH12187.1 methyltransferase domain-containing protein [Litorilituus lipolyticus]